MPMCSPQVLGLRKSLSRESSDGEIHLRSRQKPCRSASFNHSMVDIAWAAAPHSMLMLPPGLAAHMSMLDLNSLKECPRSGHGSTLGSRAPSRSLSATSLILWEDRPTPEVRTVPSQRALLPVIGRDSPTQLDSPFARPSSPASSSCPLAAWAAPVSATMSETATAAACSHTSGIGSPSLPLYSRVLEAAPFGIEPFAAPAFLSLPPFAPLSPEQ